MQELLRRRTGIQTLILADRPNLETRRILKKLNIEIPITEPENFSAKPPYDIILIDTSDPNRFLSDHIKQTIKKAKRIFAIDHHTTGLNASTKIIALRYPAPATTEILLELSEKLGILEELLEDEPLAKLAALGLLTDTVFLTLATPKTFHYMSQLTKKINYTEIVKTLKEGKEKKTLPEKLAHIKAMQRIILKVINSKIICITHVGSYESKIANTLINLGADLAIVISPKKEKGKKYIRIILRSKEIPLTPLAETISKTFHGTYGVTMNKAGGIQIHTNQKIDKIKKTVLQIATDYLTQINGQIRPQ